MSALHHNKIQPAVRIGLAGGPGLAAPLPMARANLFATTADRAGRSIITENHEAADERARKR